MVSRGRLPFPLVVAAAFAVVVAACTSFDQQLLAYCDAHPQECTCDGGRDRVNIANVDCSINNGRACRQDGHCASKKCEKDGGPIGVCAGEAAAAGQQCILSTMTPGPCSACLSGVATCFTCGSYLSCGSGLVCSGAHDDAGVGWCKSFECFATTSGGEFCGVRENSNATLTIDAGTTTLYCLLPGADVGPGGYPCCYYRGSAGEVLQCDQVADCACDDGGACRALDAGVCPL